MPELPEVETVRRGLEQNLAGDAIVGVEVLREASIAYPDIESFARELAGHKFGKVLRRGKYLLLKLDGGTGLACHLRMSGRLLVRNGKHEPSFLRVRILLASGRELHFEDMRVFGRLWFKPKGKSFEDIIPSLTALGVEPLTDLSGSYLVQAFSGKAQAVKTALLDQHIIAGVGNIYADESLFLSGLHPTLAAGSLSAAQLERLADNVVAVLEAAIKSGGSSLRDYTDANGVNGNYQRQAWVYGRKGEPCRQCGSAIERIKLNGRSSHFCAKCQPLKKSRKKK
jgi:formamidopyrimidine-DNA glycosylase